jgi:hypothetical protein
MLCQLIHIRRFHIHGAVTAEIEIKVLAHDPYDVRRSLIFWGLSVRRIQQHRQDHDVE